MSEPQAKRFRLELLPTSCKLSPQVEPCRGQFSSGRVDDFEEVKQAAMPSHVMAKNEALRLQLAILLHATRCKLRLPSVNGAMLPPCPVKNCVKMKGVLSHMEQCTLKDCPEVHCSSSKGIMSHWKQCGRTICVVCGPVMNTLNYVQGTSSIITSTSLLNSALSQCQLRYQILKDLPPNTVITLLKVTSSASKGIPPALCAVSSLPTSSSSTLSSAMLVTKSTTVITTPALQFAPPQRSHLTSHTPRTETTPAARLNATAVFSQALRLPAEIKMPANAAISTNGHTLRANIAGVNRAHLVQNHLPAASGSHNGYNGISHANGSTLQSNGGGVLAHVNGCSVIGAQVRRTTAETISANIYGQQHITNGGTVRPPNFSSSISTVALPNGGSDSSMHTNADVPLLSSRVSVTTGIQINGGVPCARVTPWRKLGPQILKNISNRDRLSQRSSEERVIKVDAVNGIHVVNGINGVNGIKKEAVSDIVVEAVSVNGVRVEATWPTGSCIVWNGKQLCRALFPCLASLLQRAESVPFRQPVDPVLLQCPDYYDIIESPMDLSLIRRKLEHSLYTDPWQWIDDLSLMFNNCWTYNRRSTKVFKQCTKLSKLCAEMMGPLMQSMGYCCGRAYTHTPVTLHCSSGRQLCSIHAYAWYYSCDSNRHVLCEHCFLEGNGDTVTVTEDPALPPLVISRDRFKKKKNIEVEAEKLAMCVMCGRRQHIVCSLHIDEIWADGLVCQWCRNKPGNRRPENVSTAKNLPQTCLGSYLERRLQTLLRFVGGAGKVTVRVLAATRKSTEVKPGMRQQFPDGPTAFPYIAKTIAVFQEIDGVEVCFFVMHTQEYGSDCPEPNTRRSYLAYMDSVNFFKPKEFRSAVYHDIIIGYMSHVRSLGFKSVHIWACPPCEGDDYIFNCHPSDQKVPRSKRLQDWYKKMLDRAITENVVYSYGDVWKDMANRGVHNANELPYFDGDFWPTMIEEIVAQLKQTTPSSSSPTLEASGSSPVLAPPSSTALPSVISLPDPHVDQRTTDQRSGSVVSVVNAVSRAHADDINSTIAPTTPNKKTNKKKNKSKSKDKKQRKNGGKSTALIQSCPQDIHSKLLQYVCRHKEGFFVIHLVPYHNDMIGSSSSNQLPPIVDPDPLIAADLMDMRGNFLMMARDQHCEFSSLRRAKFSTMVMLYEVHRELDEAKQGGSTDSGAVADGETVCNHCEHEIVETRYRCTTCLDFDLCSTCYSSVGHEHGLEKITCQSSQPTLPNSGGHLSHSSSLATDQSGSSRVTRGPFTFTAQRCSLGSGQTVAKKTQMPVLSDNKVADSSATNNSTQFQVRMLEHASSCTRGSECVWTWCERMRVLVAHTRTCSVQTCMPCGKVLTVATVHSQACMRPSAGPDVCPVVLCAEARLRAAEARRQRTIVQAQMMQRRMAMMDSGMGDDGHSNNFGDT